MTLRIALQRNRLSRRQPKINFLLRPVVVIFALLFIAQTQSSFSQIFPSFSPAVIPNSSIVVDAGVSAASVPNGLFGTVLMSVFSSGVRLAYNILTDGVNSF